MDSVVGGSADKGDNIKGEPEKSTEVSATDSVEMATNVKKSFEDKPTPSAIQQTSLLANSCVNQVSQKENLANASLKTNIIKTNYEEILSEDSEYAESIKGRFSWKLIGGCNVPYIIRVINGKHLKFVSVRMAETQLLDKYLRYLHTDIYTGLSVKSHLISDSEARLLNEINLKHAGCLYGIQMFVTGKECIVSLDDVHEFNAFLTECYNKTMFNYTHDRNDRCGYKRIDSAYVVPYITRGGQKYVPLFYFEGITQSLIPQSVQLKNWDLAYLKFCCKVQGVKNHLFASDSCTVVNLDSIKKCYSPKTHFEEYWPTKLIDSQILKEKSNSGYIQGAWTRAPSEVVPAENNIPHTLIEPAQAIPQNIPVIYQNGQAANQM